MKWIILLRNKAYLGWNRLMNSYEDEAPLTLTSLRCDGLYWKPLEESRVKYQSTANSNRAVKL
ncbi:hypothetical protein [Vibrio parahaemolyticus]|uniref:hypothetical protein n=1 Tax=Vibrio parahaemolyticus TaxID=670 RepID=UPI00235E39E7|nr:hypothetical protein [Vibrio parahaemolyticus]